MRRALPIPVEPGQLICIPPDRVYATGIGAQPRGELVWLLLQATGSAVAAGDMLATAIADLGAAEPHARPAPELTVALVVRALVDPTDDGDLTRAWRESLCTSALLELARGARDGAEASPMHPGLRRVAGWVEEHIEEPITAGQLVETAGMSPTHFYQQFARTFGTSPKDYVLRAKISRAEQLLVERTDSVSAIAHSLGFSTSQHFGTAFRRYVEMSPSEYRSRALSG